MDEPLHTHDRNAQGGQQENERAQKCRHDASSMVAKRTGFRGRSCRQDMCIEGGEQRTLINEVMTGVADQSNAVDENPADELSDNDDRIEPEGEAQSGL
jgi:hypothetical protein